MSRIIQTIILSIVCSLLIFSACTNDVAEETEMVIRMVSTTVEPPVVSTYLPMETPLSSSVVNLPAEDLFSIEDVELIALVTMAEAEGECEEGQRLVIDTILNRMDSEYFPDTIYDVIYQPYQFSSMWNGRTARCYVRDDICQLIREELESRTNYNVVFFTAGSYSKYGVPMFQVENHYFSSYD